MRHDEFLELIVVQDELLIRQERLIQRSLKAAGFCELMTLDGLDFQFNASTQKKQICDLATCQFIRQRQDVLLFGPAAATIPRSLGWAHSHRTVDPSDPVLAPWRNVSRGAQNQRNDRIIRPKTKKPLKNGTRSLHHENR